MFDGSLPGLDALAEVDDATLVGAITGWARVSAAAEARRLAAVAELARRRCGDVDDERALWACDGWDAAAAEVSAALNVGHGRAISELDLGVTLRDRLPKLNALFVTGTISAWTVAMVVDRTLLVVDEEVLAELDTVLAQKVSTWGRLSKYKLSQTVDHCIDRLDPAAVRRTRTSARSRDVSIGDPDEKAGTSAIWGRLYNTDAALLDRRLTAMARGVCEGDPRTLAQRRADALGALAAGDDRLACGCDDPACPAAGEDGRAASVVVHIVADQHVLTARPDPAMNGEGPLPAEPPDPRPAAGVIPGGGIVPAPVLAELICGGAKVRYVRQPGADAEPGYRLSTALAEFVRVRDLACRHPGCDRPAEYTDIDHTIAWPGGVTHPSNLKCYCRRHHLLKTFWTGAGGWSDRQLPDGTVLVTTPAGLTYTTKPGSALLFPGWNTTTSPLPSPSGTPITTRGSSGLTMPTRKRTRAQNRAHRIQAERTLNENLIADREPPPF